MSVEANKETIKTFLACFGRTDIDAAMAHLSEDCVWRIVGKPALFPMAGDKTKGEMTTLFKQFVPLAEDGWNLTITNMIGEGDQVAVEFENHAKYADGRVYNNHYHMLVTLRDGEVVRIHEYMDLMHAAEILLDSSNSAQEAKA